MEHVLSVTLSTLCTLSLSHQGLGVCVACCPFVPCSTAGCLPLCTLIEHASPEDLEKGLLVITFMQGSLGLLKIGLGDFIGGAYTLLLATIGFNSRRAGPTLLHLLKTYVMMSFLNGMMSSIDLLQNLLMHNLPVILMSLPMSVNLTHVVQMVGPTVSFAGARVGWYHIEKQQDMALEASMAYYRQLAAMQHHRWPPLPVPGLPLPPMPPSSNDQGIPQIKWDPQQVRLVATASRSEQQPEQVSISAESSETPPDRQVTNPVAN